MDGASSAQEVKLVVLNVDDEDTTLVLEPFGIDFPLPRSGHYTITIYGPYKGGIEIAHTKDAIIVLDPLGRGIKVENIRGEVVYEESWS